MIHQIIDIKLDYASLGIQTAGYQPKLYTYVLDNFAEIDSNRVRPAVLICPGGGYGMTSDREAEAVALRFNSYGFQAFILRYSVAPAEFPAALLELASAMALVKRNAGEWHVDLNRLVVAGFSAGGHLACSLGCFWNREDLFRGLGLSREEIRPCGMILSYPVITSGPFAHRGSFQNLLAGQYDEKVAEMSLENQVSGQTPPVFLWHTYTDDTVPVENSLLLAGALRKHGVSLEMHIYPSGGHGLSLANEETRDRNGYGVQTDCQGWTDLAARWLAQLSPSK